MTDSRTLPLIAVVEDDAPLRKALGRLLRIAGFEVVLFESAEDYVDASVSPICLVVDVLLPRMSGVELLQQLQTTPDPPPVIITTAGHEASIRERAERNGCAAFFWKPVDPESLIETINALVGRGNEQASESQSLR